MPESNSPVFKEKNVIGLVAMALFFFLFIYCWIDKLEVLPGLHGDEAWSGLKADHFIKHSFDQINGMNNYSGILQVSLAEITFRFFNTTIFDLRIGGVIFNIIGLLIICYTLVRHCYFNCALAFLAILAQSALYLTSPRVAWEVNTFTLFFLSLLLISAIHIDQGKQNAKLWVPVLLLTNMLGAYNHIIFAAVPSSIFAGLCLWGLYYSSAKYKKLTIVFGISLFNIVILFGVMNFFQKQLLFSIDFIPFIVAALLLVDYLVFKRLSDVSLKVSFTPGYLQPVIKILLLDAVLFFLIYHGRAFFDVLAGYKIFLQNYSYECSLPFRLLLIACAIVFLFYLLKYLWQDFQSSHSSVYVFLIIAYLGVINLYTVRTSFRYYLAAYAMIAIYMAFKLSSNLKRSIPLIVALLLSFIVIGKVQFEIFSGNQASVRAVNFTIGNGQGETSAHFLSKQPLIYFLRNNQVGHISYLNASPYFLSLPIQFYRIQQPWNENGDSRAIVGYDFNNYKNGLIFYSER